MAAGRFPNEDLNSVYEAIFSRRDVRGQFTGEPLSDDVVARLLTAAHYAPSVGFMQPWTFIVIRSQIVRRRVHELFQKANSEAAQLFEGQRGHLYRSLKLEGILESSLNLCITCDPDRAGPNVLGRTHDRSTDVYSSVCAVQNLWLAARAEGIGVGWVSILDQDALRDVLGIPERVIPVAYLCVGPVSRFSHEPDLEQAGWRRRLPLEDLICFDNWSEQASDQTTLVAAVRSAQGRVEAKYGRSAAPAPASEPT